MSTGTGGRCDLLSNNDLFIEETEESRLLRVSLDKVRWEYVNATSETTVGALHWSRYLTSDQVPIFLKNVT